MSEIIHDIFLLSIPSSDATIDDKVIADELVVTLLQNRKICVGMAANMIGHTKKIIAFFENDKITIMYNPVILSFSEPYEAEEGCLCHQGVRKVIRYRKIKIQYLDNCFKKKIKTYYGFTAEIILHEIDHLSGVLI